MYTLPSRSTSQPTGDGAASALSSQGLATAGPQVTLSWGTDGLSVALAPSLGTPDLPQQQALDSYLAGFGYAATYPMTLTAPQPTATPSTVTVTADTGDASFAGDVEFYVNGTLQGTVAATGGKASLPVTGNASGDVTVTAWVPAYGYASVTLIFP